MNDWKNNLWEVLEISNMKTVLITVEIYDNSTAEDIERAISAGLDNNGIDCTYDVEEREAE